MIKPNKKCLLAVTFCFFTVAFSSTLAAQKIKFEFNASANNPYLHLPFVSAVIEDVADPARSKGIVFNITSNSVSLAATDYQLSAASNNTLVVKSDSIKCVKQNGSATVYIKPSGVGYADIAVTLTSQSATKILIINYAASSSPHQTLHTTWHTGNADASAALPFGNNYMLVADDEISKLYLFNRNQSGLPLSEYAYADKLDLTDGTAPFYKEVDVEAGAFSPRNKARTYWTGSMSNNSSFAYKPNRNRIFAVDLADTGVNTTFSCIGYSGNLRQQLIKWGDNYGYQFGKAAREGQNPKAVEGFNIEGMAFAPDSSTLYIGFRAPLVPVSDRKNTVLAPVENFETWFNNGKPKGNPVIAKPIELNLGGRGIRDMVQLSNGVYVIVAGSSGENANGAIYRWSGNRTDSAILLSSFKAGNLKLEAVIEMDDEKGNLIPNALQVLSDNGSTVFYGDNSPAKLLLNTNFKKFRSDIIYSTQPVLDKNWQPSIP